MTDVAIIQFPGSNCEYETLDAVQATGLSAEIISWNISEEDLSSFKAYILPGGFSFQDRVRAGVVSSRLPLMTYLGKAALAGKPILGICNGCQILAESGILPTQDDQEISMALAPNIVNNEHRGFVCDWVYVKIKSPENNIFTREFSENDVLPIQINHGEGNFKFKDKAFIDRSSFTKLVYCSEAGDIEYSYPVNPNGADLNIAGISNDIGNVLAIMPHPERGVSWYQIPRYLNHETSLNRRKNLLFEGPWKPFFVSLANYIKEN
jgi:phosphoribosylformylglycinamidine synthase subunit PurQ / glutaminase